MGKSETGNERVQDRTRYLIRIAFSLKSRGIDIDDLTLGEILYLEEKASEREQIDRACAAQSPEMMPKNSNKVSGSQAIRDSIKGRYKHGTERDTSR